MSTVLKKVHENPLFIKKSKYKLLSFLFIIEDKGETVMDHSVIV